VAAPANNRAMARERIDRLLLARGLVETRTRARALIEAGKVSADGQVVRKPSELVEAGAQLSLAPDAGFVSRGGLKLAGALEDLHLAPAGMVVADIGASTGGFTDCLLRAGARRVYAIDVGRAQLHASLRADPRVVSLERVNARALHAASLPELVDLVVVDASFIGLAKLLPALVALLANHGQLLALVKPQFEVGPAQVGKHGVVRSDALRAEALRAVVESAASLGFTLCAQAESRVPGPRGNREIFALFARTAR
jgi:23S rRNA (cytidine1920-2'-O)/16S rRNA (cytidine1409-2'-O)-methyltransferase